MASTRNQIIEFIEQSVIPDEKIDDALAATKVLPDGKAWLAFINQLLLWLGGLAIAFAAMFFFAYNWNDMSRFAKFGMVEALMVFAVLAYWKLDQHKVAAKLALLMATIFLGVLLALYNQTYQTGADPWQLFFFWALLMLPWAVIGRFPAIWILWIALINLSIVLYLVILRSQMWSRLLIDSNTLWVLFAVNIVSLAIWELLSNKRQWLSERWAVRLLAFAGGVVITWLVILSIFDRQLANARTVMVWIAWLVGMSLTYRIIKHDLFMLAGAVLSGIIVIVSFFIEKLLHNINAGSLLFITVLIIGMGTGAAIWLKIAYREFQS
jgi:uncharacterized membrane protein